MGHTSPLIQETVDSIYSLQNAQGKYSAAEKLAFQAFSALHLNLETKKDEKSLFSYVNALQRLIASYIAQQKWDEALGFCSSIQEICKPREKWFLEISIALNEMGNIFVSKGADFLQQAEECYQQSMKIFEEFEKNPHIQKGTKILFQL
jgi:tetratricopeptide (TPR) repeat protein